MSGPDLRFNQDKGEIRCLRRELEEEISWLQRHFEALSNAVDANDIALRRTYNSMLFSRRALLGRMPR
ncbi:hypothetical protein ACJJIW_07575 [Microbulbifer sp. JMSA004]|uniref:hypothetical protein n=1 Tax=unclassified Microbulbifer TaxID=2619833 RepID=UPI0024ADE33E|nr:hypothetical protein [Microbulbifer sp. VAAF005]WHI45132.1 hypothetical protein P0078_15515 [Microbulbifer sp. VAAF005]